MRFTGFVLFLHRSFNGKYHYVFLLQVFVRKAQPIAQLNKNILHILPKPYNQV